MNLHQKLLNVRRGTSYLQKENQGKQYNFVSSSQTLGAVRKKMDDAGLLLIPRVVSHEVIESRTKSGAASFFTTLAMEYTWLDVESGETLACSWCGQGVDSGEKGIGKALTYAEKYFFLKFFNIATDKDDPDTWQNKLPDDDPEQAKADAMGAKVWQQLLAQNNKDEGRVEVRFRELGNIPDNVPIGKGLAMKYVQKARDAMMTEKAA